VHLQVDPKKFVEIYNIAQLVAGPVLAAATNSPILFGRRLWRETRLALFQQSMDTRQASPHSRDSSPRVNFGSSWVQDSVLEIFREDIARFRVLLGTDIDEDPFEALAEGRAPQLGALRLHNGTVYRWNRPCYGVGGGKPHLRIENRILPAGPTIVDEVSNTAFWIGLIHGLHREIGDIRPHFDFDDAHGNLVSAARLGLGAYFDWSQARQIPARDLILKELLPTAQRGLDSVGIASADSARYLGIIEKRVASGLTGAQWQLSSLAAMRKQGTRTERLAAVTAGLATRQEEGSPVHAWSLARIDESGGWKQHYQTVSQYMSTDLFTVNQDEAIDLVACLMDWRHIRHVPVEDDDHRLVGLVSARILLRLVAQGWTPDSDKPVPVSAVMQRNIVTVLQSTTTLAAIELMRDRRISCLPVVDENRSLIGMVTEYDLVRIASPLLEQELRD
ncbi:MAG: CBS domain-containing protein, partial [Planctomycetes bacterium]|nr:CBS domain-containing protein [Planctomycetota bacterium]